jgi:multiple sugar transport system substrate-binding protein
MKRIVTVMVMAALCVGTIFAEGKKEGANKTVELNFLEVLTSPGRTEVLKGIISTYEAAHPGVKINLISPPYEQADNKLTMMLNAEQPLDIVEVRDYTAKQYVVNKRLENLEPYLAKWDGTKTLLSVTKEAARTVDNTAYYIPQFFYIKALFVRTDILKKYGITEMPKTIDEMYAMAKKITDPSKNQYGFDFRGKNYAFKISDLLITSDIPMLDVNDTYRMKDGRTIFESAEFLTGLKKYIALYEQATPKDAINWGFNEQINAFVSGITPFLIQDPDTVPLVDEQLGRDKYTVIPMPIGATGKVYLDYGFNGLGIPSYSKNKQAAWEFISYISSSEVNADFCKKYGPLPIHTTAFKTNPYFSSGVYQAWATTMTDSSRFVFVKYPLGSDKFPGWSQVQEQYMQAALLGKITPEEAVKQWTSYWK